ncbi:prepilin-type N-terminal cleavage/methylation domain-containing protein [Planctomycetota bacterium]|nr:prepilin-type N-terminal cleavage/methylation domain-containing protein [Planctomycetota bacterium]
MNKRINGFSLIELAVVVVVLAMMIVLVLPMLGARHPVSISRQNNYKVRGIHQSLVWYAQSNRSMYPGFNGKREIVAPTVEERFYFLLDGGFFTADYAISPAERKEMWTTGEVTSKNYSYAMLDITVGDEKAKRACEWRENLNSVAAVMGDRNVGEDGLGAVESIHKNSEPGKWKGSVAWNDNHVSFESTHVVKTKFDKYLENESDNLFVAESEGEEQCDALWVYEGE